MQLYNLTPHALTLIADGATVTIPTDGPAPRLVEDTCATGTITHEGAVWPVTEVGHGAVHGLPDPQEGVALVVSQFICQAYPHRRDLYFPYPLVRDENGRIIGAAGLGQAPRSALGDNPPSGGCRERKMRTYHTSPAAIDRVRDAELERLHRSSHIPAAVAETMSRLARDRNATLTGSVEEGGFNATLPCELGLGRCGGDRITAVMREDQLFVGVVIAAHDVWSDMGGYPAIADIGQPYVCDNLGAYYDPSNRCVTPEQACGLLEMLFTCGEDHRRCWSSETRRDSYRHAVEAGWL